MNELQLWDEGVVTVARASTRLGPAQATQIRREDQHFTHIVSQIRGHVDGLKGDLRRHFVDHADETRSERNARIMREKPARFDGEDEISLPLSRKRRVPVYGNSRAAAFDARAARAGNPHVFGADSASVSARF